MQHSGSVWTGKESDCASTELNTLEVYTKSLCDDVIWSQDPVDCNLFSVYFIFHRFLFMVEETDQRLGKYLKSIPTLQLAGLKV